ncbi:DoxX family protein [Spirosoma areae]
MKHLIRTGRTFYGVGLIGLGIQHVLYADFRPVILPQWPGWLHGLAIWAYLAGIGLMVAGAAIIFSRKAGRIALGLGGVLFLFFIGFHVPYQVFISPNSFHLGLWTDALKEIALSGGAFSMADSFSGEDAALTSRPSPLMEKVRPLGKIFFSIMLVAFGIDHFLYTEGVATLVPAWIPGPVFWTYFAAVALIGSGIAIQFTSTVKPVGLLLGIMLLLWLIVLHIPRAMEDPYMAEGNEVTSAFEALAFSGIAFVIALMPQKQGQFNPAPGDL